MAQEESSVRQGHVATMFGQVSPASEMLTRIADELGIDEDAPLVVAAATTDDAAALRIVVAAASRRATEVFTCAEGISMFYGSANAITAIREIAAHGTRLYARIGCFKNKRELVVLNLTQLPALPSIFDKQSRPKYGVYQFFTNFQKNVAAPVHPDGRPHMQYLPTQVVTEFFRWVPRTKIDGIKFSSAQDGEPTYVLFVDRSEVADELPAAKPLAADAPVERAGGQQPASFDDFILDDPDPVLTLHQSDVKTYKVLRRIEATPLN